MPQAKPYLGLFRWDSRRLAPTTISETWGISPKEVRRAA